MDYSTVYANLNLPAPFKKEELFKYFEKMHAGDKMARDEIIKHNIKLVIHIVKTEFINKSEDVDELVSIGLIGLIKGVDTFDINYKNEFSTYASRCIINTIINFLNKNKHKKHIDNYSLDEVIDYDEYGFEITISDTICDEEFDIISNYEDIYEYQNIKHIIDLLPKKESEIIKKYFGFINETPIHQRELANLLGISHQCVSKKIKRILEKIRLLMQEQENIKSLVKK